MKVILAVESSAPSESAIQAVATRPWPPNTSIEAISVVEPSYAWNVPSLVEGLRQAAEQEVQAIGNRLRASGVNISTRLLFGDPKTTILDRATQWNADFIVLGARTASGIKELIQGGVANSVVRFAPCSVEIVRECAQPLTKNRPLRILLATDGSEHSEVAAQSVAGRPWPPGTEGRTVSVEELHVLLCRP